MCLSLDRRVDEEMLENYTQDSSQGRLHEERSFVVSFGYSSQGGNEELPKIAKRMLLNGRGR